MKKINWLHIAVILVAGLVLAILFMMLRPKPVSAPQTDNTQQEVVESLPSPAVKTFDLEINGRQLKNGVGELIKVLQGDEVVLNIISDESGKFHLHSYDISADLIANKHQEIKFKADTAGRFEFEIHEFDASLGAIEVSPK